MGIRVTPGNTQAAQDELNAYIKAYSLGPASVTDNTLYWTPDPTDAEMLQYMEYNTAELIPMEQLMQMVMAA
jgi:hypothetical protein